MPHRAQVEKFKKQVGQYNSKNSCSRSLDDVLYPLLIIALVLTIVVTLTQASVILWIVSWRSKSKQSREIVATKPPRTSKQSEYLHICWELNIFTFD